MADMRIGGLASGMDIDSIVGDLMKAERIPLDKLEQKKQTLEWQRDDYRSINTLLLDFRSELTQMKLTTQYRARTVSSTDDSKVTATASSAASASSYTISDVGQLADAAVLKNAGTLYPDGTAKEDKLDVTKGLFAQSTNFANAGNFNWEQGIIESKKITASADNEIIKLNQAVPAESIGSMSIKVNGTSYQAVTGVQQSELQENQVLVNPDGELTFQAGVVKKGATVSAEYVVNNKIESPAGTGSIKEWQLAKGSIHEDTFKLTVDGVDYEIGAVDSNDPKQFQLVAMDGTGASIGKINTETGKITFTSEQAATTLSADYQQNYTAFSLGAHTSKGVTNENFLVVGNESMNAVMNEVNNSNAGVTMFYDSFSDQMTLTRKETGDFNENETDSATGAEIINPEITTSGAFLNQLLRFEGGEETGGQNAEFTVNGLTTQRTSNTFDISGVTFTLKQTFSGETASLSVNNDNTAVFDNIKNFVETYNTLIGAISSKTSEQRYRDYGPLTDAQRESLSDKQQEQWEEKAKSGLLRRDSTLTGALSSMRMDFYSPVSNNKVSNVYSQLASIGITTSSNYLEGGKLELNEAKLKAALQEDPESVENLFRGSGESYGEKGIVQRLSDTVTSTMDKISARAGKATSTNQQFTLGRNLTNIDDQIERFQDRLQQTEDRYWRQFTAMEKAIQQANSQSAYLMQQFSF